MGIPLIVPTTATSEGFTLATYRHRLADEMGFWHPATTSAVATSADAARVVLSNDLRDDENGYEYMGRWLYVLGGAQAGTQRRIIEQDDVGYQGELGAVLLSRPLSAALASSVSLEVTSPLPVKRHLGIKGLNEIVNEALARIWIPARLTFTGNGTYSYDLTTDYPWLQREEQTLGISDTRYLSTDLPPERSSFDYRFVLNGATRTMVTDSLYQSSETFYLDVIVRADRLVFDGASWSYATTPGLLGESYAGAAPEEWALAFGMVKGLEYLARLVMMDRRMDKEIKAALLADATSRLQTWKQTAARIAIDEFPQSAMERTESMIGGYNADPIDGWREPMREVPVVA